MTNEAGCEMMRCYAMLCKMCDAMRCYASVVLRGVWCYASEVDVRRNESRREEIREKAQKIYEKRKIEKDPETEIGLEKTWAPATSRVPREGFDVPPH